VTDNPASSLRRLAITASENPTRKLQRRGDDDRNGVGIPLPEAATTVTVYSARRSVPPAPPLTQSTIRTSAPNRIATVVLWRLGPAKDYRRLLRYLKSIVYFDTEVADGARAWHVRGEVALLAGSWFCGKWTSLRASQRVGFISCRVQSHRCDPWFYLPSIVRSNSASSRIRHSSCISCWLGYTPATLDQEW